MNELAIIASKAMAQRKQLTMIAENVANTTTDGFKKMDMKFEEVVSRNLGQNVGSYTREQGIRFDAQQGPLKLTNNPLDIAIQGEGYFAIDVNGSTQYTKNGHFTLSPEGFVVTEQGFPLLGIGGGPLAVPPEAEQVVVTPEGTLATEDGAIAEIGVFAISAEDMNQMQRTGAARFLPIGDVAIEPVAVPSLVQGALEGSNVNAFMEMVNMQELSQRHISANRMISNIEDLQERAIRTLAAPAN